MHWLCLWFAITPARLRWGDRLLQHHEQIAPKSVSRPCGPGKGYGFESLQALCDYAFHRGIRRLTATVTAGEYTPPGVCWKKPAWLEGELRGELLPLRLAGIMTGYSVYYSDYLKISAEQRAIWRICSAVFPLQ